MKPSIILPDGNAAGQTETVSGDNNLILVGANGAGKTRMGSWIEFNQLDVVVHRISAQRVLNIPVYAEMRTLEAAQKALLFGSYHEGVVVQHKISNRWGGDSAVSLLSDYDKLLSTLFARRMERDSLHTEATKTQQIYIEVPEDPIDIIKRVWADIMPQNAIDFKDGKVLVTKGDSSFHGKEMSDGERVALYLIGQCLCAPENSIIIIDEPEIHLHRSIMTRLWAKVEELSPNKTLIYISHDLDFVASRIGVTKIWIKNYLNNTWNWKYIPEIDELPGVLILEIIGNRKNILFCEGTKSSFDYSIYQAVYPDFHIMPRGSSVKVIESTRAFNNSPALHHLQFVGIVDGDYRTTQEIAALNADHIYTLNVAEIENLFCVEPLLRIVAQHLAIADIDAKIQEVSAFIIKSLQDEFDAQVANHAEREIQFRLNSFVKTSNSKQGIQDGFNSLTASIDIAAIFAHSRGIFQQAIDQSNLELVLRIYNRKSLAKRISSLMGLANGEYTNIVLRLLKTNQRTNIIAALQVYLPQL